MPARKWEKQDKIQMKKILKTLRESKLSYLNIQQIADEAGMYRDTVAKYIPVLVKTKKIETLNTGRWDIYKIRN
jgi:predicted AAA+ superfamily ATPase